MRNLYTCQNCIYNPSQYLEVGTKTGFCLKHDSLIFQASITTCRFFKRKDLPSFLAEEGIAEHVSEFTSTQGLVNYQTKMQIRKQHYSEEYCWNNDLFDPLLHEVTIYYKMEKKWPFLRAASASRHPIKGLIHSCLVRRYISQCGAQKDNYSIVLDAVLNLKDFPEFKIDDFRMPIEVDQYLAIKDIYAKDITLLKIYGIQEYGELVQDDNIMWATEELNGAVEYSIPEFINAVNRLIPWLKNTIIRGSQARGTFFPHS